MLTVPDTERQLFARKHETHRVLRTRAARSLFDADIDLSVTIFRQVDRLTHQIRNHETDPAEGQTWMSCGTDTCEYEKPLLKVREKASRLADERGLTYSPDQHIADMWGGVRRLVEIRLGLDDGSFGVTDEKACGEVLAARNRAINGLQNTEETIGSWIPEHFARIRMYKRW